jgi:hypothetical protein
MTRATAITVWEMGLPRLSALHAVSRMDDHANRHKLMQAIKDALIGMSGRHLNSSQSRSQVGTSSRKDRSGPLDT